MNDNAHLMDEKLKLLAVEVTQNVKDLIDGKFAQQEEKQDKKEESLVKRVLQEIKPIFGEFKDRAVDEANKQALGYITSTFNTDPTKEEDRRKRQLMDQWIERSMQKDEQRATTISQVVIQKLLSRAIDLVGIGVAVALVWQLKDLV